MKPITFTQSTPASQWTITHGFGYKPAVDVMVDDGPGRVKMMPAVVRHVNDQQMILTFNNPESGVARLA